MPSRLVFAAACAVGLAVTSPAGPAAADLGLPTAQPSVPAPSVPAPSVVPSLPVPDPVATAGSLLAPSAPEPEPAPAPAAGTADTRTPKINPESLPVPSAPALPSLPGGGGGGGGGGQEEQGGTGGSSPVGDDVLPAALEKELCAVLTTLLGPLPEQVRGLPANVIGQLPKQITDAVPADVLRTVTLHCPQPAAATPQTEVRNAVVQRPVTKTPAKKPATRTPKAAPTGSSSLPHTGLGIGLPLAGLGLLAGGIWLRRRLG